MSPLESISFRRSDGVLSPRWFGPEDHVWIECLLDELRRLEGAPVHAWRVRNLEPLRVAAPERGRRFIAGLLEELAGRVEAPTTPSPSQLRARLFAAAQAARGAGRFDRGDLIAETSQHLGLSPDAAEARLFGDVPTERRLTLPAPLPDPATLARRANLAIARTLVRSASRVEIHLESRSRAVLRQILLQRLLFVARPVGRGVSLEVSGPMALFRHSTLYGRALGSLVPVLHGADRFVLLARCQLRGRAETVQLGSGDPIVPEGHLPRRFDSKLEERFARDFERLAPDWDLIREPEPIEADGTFVFPDFALVHRRDGRRWLLEIVGFWTEEYLRHKLARLACARRSDLIVCIDEKRGGPPELLASLGERVIAFGSRVDAARVLALIERATPTCVAATSTREALGLESLYLDFAGRHVHGHPIHQHLAALGVGDEVLLRPRGDWVHVVDCAGQPIAALAGPAKERWRGRLDEVRRVTVRAIVDRTREDSHPAFRDKLRVDRWRLPLLEVELATPPVLPRG